MNTKVFYCNYLKIYHEYKQANGIKRYTSAKENGTRPPPSFCFFSYIPIHYTINKTTFSLML